MDYQLGVDVGTTFTAAAVSRGPTALVVPLTSEAAVMPTLIAADPDGTVLVGEPAAERLRDHPEQVVYGFKRRLGDPTPIPLPLTEVAFPASWYLAHVVATVVESARRSNDGPPRRVAITHPANWHDHKVAKLLAVAATAGLDPATILLLTEPEAAALAHASNVDVAEGETIAVYDLGGGTFDTAVLERRGDGYVVLGRPEGIDRLGGLDFDAALYRYVGAHLRRTGLLETLEPTGPQSAAWIARLQENCRAAKEDLSYHPLAEVAIPGTDDAIAIDRASLEAIIRPALMETIGALRRALAGAQLNGAEVSRVLLAGGSSKIPLVAELVSEELDRSVVAGDDPKQLVALGAALAAADGMPETTSAAPPPQHRTPLSSTVPVTTTTPTPAPAPAPAAAKTTTLTPDAAPAPAAAPTTTPTPDATPAPAAASTTVAASAPARAATPRTATSDLPSQPLRPSDPHPLRPTTRSSARSRTAGPQAASRLTADEGQDLAGRARPDPPLTASPSPDQSPGPLMLGNLAPWRRLASVTIAAIVVLIIALSGLIALNNVL